MTHYEGIRWTSAEILRIEEKVLDLLTKKQMSREELFENLKVSDKKLERAMTGLHSYSGVKVVTKKKRGYPTLYNIEINFQWR